MLQKIPMVVYKLQEGGQSYARCASHAKLYFTWNEEIPGAILFTKMSDCLI